MENIDEYQKKSIFAAETYLHAKRNMLPGTVAYVFQNTYNYLLTKLKRYV